MRNDLSIHPPAVDRREGPRGWGSCEHCLCRRIVNVAGGVRKCLHGFSLVFRLLICLRRLAWLPELLLNPWALYTVHCPLSVVRCPLHVACMLPVHVAVVVRVSCCHRAIAARSHTCNYIANCDCDCCNCCWHITGATGRQQQQATTTGNNSVQRLEHIVKLIYNMMSPWHKHRQSTIVDRQSVIDCSSQSQSNNNRSAVNTDMQTLYTGGNVWQA